MSNPYEGDSLTTTQAGLTGTNTALAGNGERSIGVLGHSENGEGVHGETNSTQYAAVAGIELNAKSNIAAVYGEQRGNGPGIYGIAKGQGHGVFGHSETGEGVHGETNSTQYAAVAGINLNLSGTGAGVYGQSLAKGPAVIGHSDDGEGVHGETYSSQFAAVAGIQLNTSGTIAAVYGEQRGNGPGIYGLAKGQGHGVFGHSETGEGVHGETNSLSYAAVAGIALNPNGTAAGIYGQSLGHGPAAYFEGNVQVTGDIVMPAADFAEDFAVEASDVAEPGTVMVLDDNGVLRASVKSYDKKVAGVISGAGDYRPGLILDRHESSDRRLPVALVGKVYCKADTTFGAIEVGDLLTTSPTPGHAMKAADPLKAFGAVIGKAMRPLESGCGLVPILIALQ